MTPDFWKSLAFGVWILIIPLVVAHAIVFVNESRYSSGNTNMSLSRTHVLLIRLSQLEHEREQWARYAVVPSHPVVGHIKTTLNGKKYKVTFRDEGEDTD